MTNSPLATNTLLMEDATNLSPTFFPDRRGGGEFLFLPSMHLERGLRTVFMGKANINHGLNPHQENP